MGLAYLFISHDLSVVRHVSHQVAVMYLGEIVEAGSADEILARAAHPYTKSLLSAVPSLRRPGERERTLLRGEVPGPVNPPPGCRFHTRCPAFIGDICREVVPEERVLSPGHTVRCHLFNELPAAPAAKS
jgi:oligopeptide/dipeptide ABC transporter ATP-binding protein